MSDVQSTHGVRRRRAGNPSDLTPNEAQILALHQSGMSHSQIAAVLGGKWSGKNVGMRMQIIREKLACQ